MDDRTIKIPSIAYMAKELEKAGKLPKPRVFQMPPVEDAFKGIEDIGIGPQYVTHLRKGEYHAEFGGPKTDYLGCYIVDVYNDPNEVGDSINLYGPDINELQPESIVPYIHQIKLYGKDLTLYHMEYLGRAFSAAAISSDGWMFTGTQSEPWIRVGKKAVQKYNYTFAKFGQLMRAYLLTTVPIVEKFEMNFFIGEPIKGDGGLMPGAAEPVSNQTMKDIIKAIHNKLSFYDIMVMKLQDEEVDTFYGCTLCKMIAPNHACVVSPTNIPFCGFASWSGLKVGYEVEPGGYVFSIARGKQHDPQFHWYEGVDNEMYTRSNQAYKHFFLNSSIVYPATNCGCFEAASFYIPEVDGIGIVHRRYLGDTPLGIPYSSLAGFMSGGEQNHGFKGVSLRNAMMKYFLHDDGGWDRIVWMPKTVKEEIAESIPEELYDKIATEEDALDPDDLKEWLRKKNHPIVRKFWVNGEPDPLTLPPPAHEWPEEEFTKAINRVKKAKEIK
jgi:acetyl-CoA decarbonylase/synthase, CODH/ACS complex subunit beta